MVEAKSTDIIIKSFFFFGKEAEYGIRSGFVGLGNFVRIKDQQPPPQKKKKKCLKNERKIILFLYTKLMLPTTSRVELPVSPYHSINKKPTIVITYSV